MNEPTPQMKVFREMRLSLRELARELGTTHPTLCFWLDDNKIPLSRPDLPERFAAFVERKRLDPISPITKALRLQEARMLTKIGLPEETIKHFGLTYDPFTNEMSSIEDIFDLTDAKRAEKKIMTAVDKAGWVAVTGKVGSGKTTLLKRVEARLAARRDVKICKPQLLEKQHLIGNHIISALIADLSDPKLAPRNLESKIRHIKEVLEESHRDGQRSVLLIDEAHLLKADTLKSLKYLYELEVNMKKVLAIVMIGQPILARQLRTNFLISEVSQRVDLYEIGAMNGHTGPYIRHKLQRAGGGDREIFTTGAIKMIADRADTPLSVNNLAAASMWAAWDLGQKDVTADTVKEIQGALER